MAAELDLQAAIQTPGGWVDLEDEDNGYTLHAESFGQRQYTKRTVTVDGIWVDGTFGARSNTGNVIETVSVWVDGFGNHFDFAIKMQTLKTALDQRKFSFRVSFVNARETWTCPLPAEYTEQLDQPYRFATIGLLKAQIQRLPAFLLEEVAP